MSAEDTEKDPTLLAEILAERQAREPWWRFGVRVLSASLRLLLSDPEFRRERRRIAKLGAANAGIGTAVASFAAFHGPMSVLGAVCASAFAIGALFGPVRVLLQRARGRHRRVRTGTAMAGFSARSLTVLAAVLAGRGGSALLQEWTAHLAGESGHDSASWGKVKQAIGFIIAGISHRCSNWADSAWKPADAVLRSRTLSNLFVAVPTIVVAVEVLTHKGTMTVLTSFGSIFGVGVALYGAIKAGRWYRDVKPPEPKARRAKEDQGA